jgi:hypothetical protein
MVGLYTIPAGQDVSGQGAGFINFQVTNVGSFEDLVIYEGELSGVAGAQTYSMSLNYKTQPGYDLTLYIAQVNGAQPASVYEVITSGGPAGVGPPGTNPKFGSGWQFKDGNIYFATNDGGGVYQVDVSSIDLTGLTATLSNVGPFNDAGTDKIDGFNCMDKTSPWLGGSGGGTTNQTTTTNTTSPSTTRYTYLVQQATGTTTLSQTCPVSAACAGQTVSKIPGLSATHGFNLGDIIDVCQSDGSEPCSRDHTIVGFASLLVNPLLSQGFTNPQVSVVSQASGSGLAGNDPFTYFGNESCEFELPVGKLTAVLHTRELSMHASSFKGGESEQWFGHVVVNNVDGFRLADIKIRKNLNSVNLTRVSPNMLQTMDVTLGSQPHPMQMLQKNTWTRMGVQVNVAKLSEMFVASGSFALDQKYMNGLPREAVMLKTPSVRLLIVSSPASEYYSSRPDLVLDYAHLDIVILDMRDRSSLRGILPELWGVTRLSNETKKLIKTPRTLDPKRIPKTDASSMPLLFSV